MESTGLCIRRRCDGTESGGIKGHISEGESMSVPLELALRATSPGWQRRDFVKACGMAAAAVGLPAKAAAKFVQNAEAGLKPSVIWLANQECTGCT